MNRSMTSKVGLKLGHLPTVFVEAASQKMDALKIDVEKAEAATTVAFKAGLVGRFRDALMNRLRPLGGDLLGIAEQTHTHRTTRWKWEHAGVIPDWDTLFVAGTAYRMTWDGVFPASSDAMLAGVCHAIAEIRNVFLAEKSACGEEGECLPCEKKSEPFKCDAAVVFLLWYATGSVRFRQAQLSNDQKALARCVDEANQLVSQMTGPRKKLLLEEMLELIDSWWDAYLLFHSLIQFHWEL